jgi:Regulator of chromosome condensation (RCC1) repeat
MLPLRSLILIGAAALCFACAAPPPHSVANLPVVSAGFETTCVLTGKSQPTCFGRSVGDGTTGAHTVAATPALGLVKSLALSHTLPFGCAIVGDPDAGPSGPVWCWIGDAKPAPVQGLADASAISVGGPGACALVPASPPADTRPGVKCWSLPNPFGTTTFVSPFFPAMPTSIRNLPVGITQVAVGGHFACAVVAANQRVYCWGKNDAGQLGRGIIASPGDPEADAAVPVANLLARRVAAGHTHACAIASDSTVRCWGSANFGQLGNGNNEPAIVPTPQRVIGITDAVNVTAAQGFSCATLGDRTARCWGWNIPLSPTAGTLGVGRLISGATVGTPTTSPTIEFQKPGAVSVPLPVKGLTGAIFISAGPTHTCASGLGGLVACWGSNSFGQLADGTLNDSIALQ